jgi:hypothetical protein
MQKKPGRLPGKGQCLQFNRDFSLKILEKKRILIFWHKLTGGQKKAGRLETGGSIEGKLPSKGT